MKIKLKIFLIFILLQTINSQSLGRVINVKNFGAKGNGRADDTKAIQDAINSSDLEEVNTIYFPKGIYQLSSYKIISNYLENYFLLLHSNIMFKGDGDGSVIRLASHLFDKIDTTANGHLLFGLNIENVHFSKLLFDMNGTTNLAPESVIKNQCAIFIIRGHNVSVKNITIKNNAGRNMIIIMGNGKKMLVENSRFLNGGHYVGMSVHNKYQVDFSFVYCEWDSTTVINNHIEQQNVDIALSSLSGGIELHGSNCYAAGNTIIGCNPGLYISSSWHAMENTTAEKNKFLQCIRGISFWVNYPMNNISIKENIIQLTHFRTWKNYTINGIEMPNGNTWVYDFAHANAAIVNNLLIADNIIKGPLNTANTDRSAGIILHSLQNTIIKNNTIKGMNFGGVIIQGSKWGSSYVSIKHNKFIDFKTNYDKVSPAGYVVVFDGYSHTDKNAPGFKKIIVSQNDFIRNKIAELKISKGKTTGVFFASFIATPEHVHREIFLSDNNFSNKEEKIVFVRTD